MSIKKCINIFICLLFTFIFVFNSVVITYASTFVAGPVAVKTFMLILASMGLIGVVNTTDWGNFYTGFQDFVKDKYDATSVLASKAYSSIKNNVKLNYSDIKNDILEYSRNNLMGGDLVLSGSYNINHTNIKKNAVPVSTPIGLIDGVVLDTFDLSNGYELVLFADRYFGNSHGLYLTKNNVPVKNAFKYTSSTGTISYNSILNPEYVGSHFKSLFSSSYSNHSLEFDINYHEDIGTYSVKWEGTDYTNSNKIKANTVPFLGIYDGNYNVLEGILNPGIDIPVTDTEEVAFPIDWVPGFVDSTGKTLDEILEELGKINDVDWEKALEGSQVNELNPPIINTDVNGVITSVDTASSSITSSINTSTNRVINSIKSIFTIGNSSLDFSPLKELELKNKFPFCLPYDLHKSIKFLQAEPKAPRFDFVLMGEELSIDFKMFEPLSKITRAFFSFLFTIAVIFFFYKNLI